MPAPLPRSWRILHAATLGLALLAGAILLGPTAAFGTSGYGGYGQIASMLFALAGSALAALAGLAQGALLLWRGARPPLLWAGLALDVGVLVALAAVLRELA